MDIEDLIDAVIAREGDYVANPADRGGPTRFGITQAVARQQGYSGDMRALPQAEAAAIYRRLYWMRPRFDLVAARAPALAAELFDTGVNMGPAVAIGFLQRALNALNRGASDYPDVPIDGQIGPRTLTALDGFLARRGHGGRGRADQGGRCPAGRTLCPPRRGAARRRGVSLRLAGEPGERQWLRAIPTAGRGGRGRASFT